MGASLIQSTAAAQTLWDHGRYLTVPRGTPLLLVARVVNGVAESRYTGLRLPGAGANYQVTAGLTLFLTSVIAVASIGLPEWYTLSATAAVGINQVTAPTGEITEDSDAVGQPNSIGTTSTSAATGEERKTLIDIAAARFPAVRGMTASSTFFLQFIGHEE